MPLPNLLVIDASILFSFFKSDSVRRHLIEELPNKDCRLISPEFVLEELFNDKEKIRKFAGINEPEFMFLFLLLKREIKILCKEEYKEFLPAAKRMSPHAIPKDDPYFALALASNCAIWSDEEAFKRQSGVKIYSTADLLEELEKKE